MSIFARTLRRHAALLPRATVTTPAQIVGVSVSNETETTADISWSADPLVVDLNPGQPGIGFGYEVRVYDDLGATAFAGTTQSTSITATGLTAGGDYTVEVRGYNADGLGAWSAPVSFSTLSVFNAPDAPTGVGVTVIDNEGPTAIQLSNQTTSLPEDTDTTSRILLANISITDDGMGTNVLSVDNPSYFEIYQGGLYLVAGAALDYETATSHSCTISATDSTTNDPPATIGFTLSVTDVVELTPPDAPTGVGVTVDEYTPAPTTDPYFSSVSLLLQDSLTDQSPQGQTVVANGDAQISATESKFGGSSIALDGTGDYLAIADDDALDFTDGGDFTIECWFFRSGTSGNGIFGRGGGYGGWSQSSGHYYLCFIQSGSLYIQYNYGNFTYPISFSTTAPSVSTWHHLAMVRSSGTITAFLNGVSFGSSATALVAPTNRNITRIGDLPSGNSVWSGYIDEFRISKGIARYPNGTNFTPPTSAFPTSAPPQEYDDNYDDVVLLLQDSLADQSPQGQTIVANGDAQISATESKFGGASLAFDGTGDFVQTAASPALQLGTDDFTAEAWVYFTALNANTTVARLSGGNAVDGILFCHAASSGVGKLFITSNGSAWDVRNNGSDFTGLTTNQWFHLALSRSGTTFRTFVNGNLISTFTSSASIYQSSNIARIGAANSDGAFAMGGYIDEFRLTKGVARYTANFTPPTSAFPAAGPPATEDEFFYDTVLLLQDSLADSSPQSRAITVNGNTQIDTAVKKYGTGSISMQSVGDTLQMTVDSSLDFSGQFTVEAWVKTTTSNGYQTLWCHRRTGGGSTDFVALFFETSTTLKAAIVNDQFAVNASSILDGDWHHVAMVRDATHLRLYLDGVQGGSMPSSATPSAIGLPLYIGTDQYYASRNFIGHMDDIRITNGIARYPNGTTFTPPTAAFLTAGPVDDSFSDVVLLLRDSTADESLQGQTITAAGTAGTSTAQSKFGGVSLISNGGSNLLTAANDPAFAMPADFTIESWIYFDTYSASESFSIWEPVNHGAGGFSSNRLQFLVYQDKLYTDVYGSVLVQSSPLGFAAGQWYHVAASRQGSTLRLFLDGTQVASTTTTRSFVADEYKLPLSRSSVREMYFDDFRVTVGTSRYNASFTPPAATHPATNGDLQFGSVSLLLQDSLADESPQGQTLTVDGNTAVSTVESKFGGSSISFDGSGDWITAAADPSLVFGTSPFTVEFWMYWNGTVTGTPYMGVMGAHNAATTGRYAIFMNANGIGHYIQSQFPAMSAVPANQWVHIASTRDSSGTCRFFIDGVLKTTVTDTGNLTAPQGFRVGNEFSSTRPPFSGYLDSIRVTTGVARYTANFTPPTSAFPN